MVFLQNAVRGSRGTVWVNEKQRNNGETKVGSSENDKQEAVNAVLLTDLFNIPTIQSFPNVFLKMIPKGMSVRPFLHLQKVTLNKFT